MTGEFKKFDAVLTDFRDKVANASTIMRDAVQRYVDMMQLLGTAFTLYFEDMTPEEKAKMKKAFDDLASHVDTFTTPETDNVHPLRKPPA